MTVRHARMLTRYNHWANQVMYDAVAALPEGEAVKERKSLFRNMVHTLNHNYVIGIIWQAHLERRDHGMTARNTPDHPPLAALWEKQQSIDGWYVRWSDALTADALDAPVSYTLIGGNKGTMTQFEVLLHIVNHSSYHRGFVADLFFQVPEKAPQMDLPVFVRERASELEAAGLR